MIVNWHLSAEKFDYCYIALLINFFSLTVEFLHKHHVKLSNQVGPDPQKECYILTWNFLQWHLQHSSLEGKLSLSLIFIFF